MAFSRAYASDKAVYPAKFWLLNKRWENLQLAGAESYPGILMSWGMTQSCGPQNAGVLLTPTNRTINLILT